MASAAARHARTQHSSIECITVTLPGAIHTTSLKQKRSQQCERVVLRVRRMQGFQSYSSRSATSGSALFRPHRRTSGPCGTPKQWIKDEKGSVHAQRALYLLSSLVSRTRSTNCGLCVTASVLESAHFTGVPLDEILVSLRAWYRRKPPRWAQTCTLPQQRQKTRIPTIHMSTSLQLSRSSVQQQLCGLQQNFLARHPLVNCAPEARRCWLGRCSLTE